MKKKLVFISVPMSGRDEALVKRQIQLAKRSYCRHAKVSAKDIEFFDYLSGMKDLENWTGVKMEDKGYKNVSLAYLSYAITALGMADEAVFCTGWKDARGCCIEHEVCVRYGIPIDDLETRKKFKVNKKTEKITKV